MVPGHRRKSHTLGDPSPFLRKQCSRYTWVQHKYWSDSIVLVRWILDRKEESICEIEPNMVTKTYQSIWGRKDDSPIFPRQI